MSARKPVKVATADVLSTPVAPEIPPGEAAPAPPAKEIAAPVADAVQPIQPAAPAETPAPPVAPLTKAEIKAMTPAEYKAAVADGRIHAKSPARMTGRNYAEIED